MVTRRRFKVHRVKYRPDYTSDILKLVATYPDRTYAPREVAQTLNMKYKTASSILSRLCREGYIVSPRRGIYKGAGMMAEGDLIQRKDPRLFAILEQMARLFMLMDQLKLMVKDYVDLVVDKRAEEREKKKQLEENKKDNSPT
jgi:predicted transcriptional regulator